MSLYARVKLTVKIETNDHDGYCSGAENEYSCKIIKVVVITTQEDILNRIRDGGDLLDVNWAPYIEKFQPAINHFGSGYCECGEQGAYVDGLGVHDARMTVIKAKVLFADYRSRTDALF